MRTLYHIRGIIDGQLVVCSFWKSKALWHYEVMDPEIFETWTIKRAGASRIQTGRIYDE